ncbi:hypothetical protein ACOMHN_057523 [Nucella lapillus]
MQLATLARLRQHYCCHQEETVTTTALACPVCDRTFGDAMLLQSHVKQDHGMRRIFRCKMCSATFTHTCNLRRHVLTHTGQEEPYPCSQSDAAFSQLSLLQRHIKALHRKRTEQCSVQSEQVLSVP